MAVFKCKMCGGDLKVIDEANHLAQWESCGTKQTLPNEDDERKANQFNRANHYRRSNEFDRAAEAYAKILDSDPGEAEAYWGIVLCRYGIEYVEDKKTMRRIPTCHRTLTRSILQDPDYQQALACAKPLAKLQYEEEAKEIDRLQKEILALASREDPFDIFISYKETDERSGQRTPDSVLGQDIYNALTKEGYNVFFSRITLESRLGQEYEPIIYAALRSSKVMIAIGTKPEYFESPWVRNEWNRYLGMIEEEPGEKTLIPVYRDMDPYDMPEEFAHLQGLNAANIGFLQDLVHGVEKLVKSGGSAPAAAAASTATVESLLQRAELFLEAGQFDNASQYCERVLDMAPKDYRPYLYQTLCHFKLRNTQELASSAKLVHMNANFQNALRFAPPSKQAELTQIAASAYANAERQYAQIKQNLEQRVAACQRESNEAKAQYDIAHQAFQKAQEIAAEYDEPMKDLEEKRSAAFEQADQYQRQAEEFYKSRNYTHKGVTTNVISMGFGLRLVVKLVYLVIGIIVAWIASWFNWMLGAIVALVTVVFVFFPNTSRKKYQTLREKEKALNEQGQQYKEAYGKLYREKESKIAECNRLKNQCNQLLDKYQNAQKDLSNTQNNLGQLNQQHETSAAKARELRVI